MSDVATVFPHVGTLSLTPFQGMTDILLVGKRNVGLLSIANLPVCCIEGGIGKEATSTIPLAVGGHINPWPEKLRELLASMYYFGTCNYINNLRSIPTTVTWTAYGVFTVRSMSCIVIKMTLDKNRCCVHLLYEGSNLTLGAAFAHVIEKL